MKAGILDHLFLFGVLSIVAGALVNGLHELAYRKVYRMKVGFVYGVASMLNALVFIAGYSAFVFGILMLLFGLLRELT